MISSSPIDQEKETSDYDPLSIVDRLRTLRVSLGRPVVVSICGGTSTGKSTQIADPLCDLLGKDHTLIRQDNFAGLNFRKTPDDCPYRFDHPNRYAASEGAEILEQLKAGRRTSMPQYEFATQTRLEDIELLPTSFLIFEGMYSNYQDLANVADFSIYTEMPLAHRLVRRVFRNKYERYRNADPARTITSFCTSVHKAHRDFVCTQKEACDIVVKLPHDFQNTIDRFRLEPLREERANSEDTWAKIGENTHIIIHEGEKAGPNLSIISNDQVYLECKLEPKIASTLKSLDPNSG